MRFKIHPLSKGMRSEELTQEIYEAVQAGRATEFEALTMLRRFAVSAQHLQELAAEIDIELTPTRARVLMNDAPPRIVSTN